ncbi:MAG: phosphatidylserine decarboxylase [Myxococcaceae bacterium]|nr:MAG: phosphatidylserine decarboxylase [Myxococcaceae bacterium]
MVPLRSRAAASLLHLLPRGRITRALGRFTEARIPRPVLRPVLDLYSRAYDVALDEAVVPEGGFRSFNEFFTRQLRPGIHTVDPDPATVVSPADGRLDDSGPVSADRRFTVKGQSYDAATLLDDPAAARAYEGGHYFIVYLSPRDYHRVHSPVAGRVREVRHIPGDLFPVNEMGVRTVPGLFARNERVVVHVDTELGPAAVVFVGAFVVGKITLTIEAPPRPELGGRSAVRAFEGDARPTLEKGDELGAFQLGSTVVVLLGPAAHGRWEAARGVDPTPVRVGDAVARARDGEAS